MFIIHAEEKPQKIGKTASDIFGSDLSGNTVTGERISFNYTDIRSEGYAV